MKHTFKSIAAIALILMVGCSTTQNAQWNATKAKISATLSTPQAQALEAAGSMIATTALSIYAPGFAWTLPLALNAASGLLADQTTAQSVATIQDTIKSVAAIPQYNQIATLAGNAVAAIQPTSDAQRIAATQALAMYISQKLPVPKS